MYERFFGFDEAPFRLTPDPRYLFLSAKHKEALGHLVYGLEDGAGFVAITGEIGAGKTTLVRSFLSDPPPRTQYAYILNPVLSGVELLQEINHELGLRESGTQRDLIAALNAHLLQEKRAGNQVVLVIDEAQALDGAILEQLRMLSNFETETAKLIQIVLVGQPELRDLLARPDLEQLDQRVSVRWHLCPLDREETAAYIAHRLATASAGRARRIFTRGALRRIYAYTSGVPRRINVLCHRALLVAYASDSTTVTWSIVGRAIREIESPRKEVRRAPRWALGPGAIAAGLMGAVLLGGISGWWFMNPGVRNSAEVVRALDAVGGSSVGLAGVGMIGQEAAGRREAAPANNDGPRVAPYPLLVSGVGEPVPPREAGPRVATHPLTPTLPPRSAAVPIADAGSGFPGERHTASSDQAVSVANGAMVTVRSHGEGVAPAGRTGFPPADAAMVTVHPHGDGAGLSGNAAYAPAGVLGSGGDDRDHVSDLRAGDVVVAPSMDPAPEVVAMIDPSLRAATGGEREEVASWPAAASPAAPDGSVALGDALRQTTPAESAYEAVADLVDVWGGEPLSASEAAMHPLDLPGIAQRRGLEYLQFRGNLSVLRVLDLPMIVELDPGRGAPLQFALVDRVDEESVRVRIGQSELEMSHRLFAEVWFGQGHVLWYDVDNLGRLLTVGVTGDRVVRLQERLRVAGFDVGQGGESFDAATEEAVMNLQRAVHLDVDGKAGPMTMIALYGLAASEHVPHLDANRGASVDVASSGVLP